MDQLQVRCFAAIRQIASKTKPMKSGREYMLQIQPDEICALYGHHFFIVTVGVAFVTKGHGLTVY